MDQKKESNLILQRSVGGGNNQFRQVVKDPMQEFKVIGVIRQGMISEQGKQVPVFYLYDLKGGLVASEKDRDYLEEYTAVNSQSKLRKTAMEKWREDELAKARKTEQPEKQAAKPPTKRRTKAKVEQER